MLSVLDKLFKSVKLEKDKAVKLSRDKAIHLDKEKDSK